MKRTVRRIEIKTGSEGRIIIMFRDGRGPFLEPYYYTLSEKNFERFLRVANSDSFTIHNQVVTFYGVELT